MSLTKFDLPPGVYNPQYDPRIAISMGLVSGARPFRVKSENPNISNTGDLEDINETGGGITLTPNGNELRIRFTHADDDSAGDGVQSVDVHYLDANFIMQETRVVSVGVGNVVLTGLTPHRIIGFHSVALGTVGGTAVGDIFIEKSDGSEIYSKISAGANMSLCSLFTVPKNHIAIGQDTVWSGQKQLISPKLRATCDLVTRELTPGTFIFQETFSLKDSALPSPRAFGEMYPEMCDIKSSAFGSVAGASVSCNYGLLLLRMAED